MLDRSIPACSSQYIPRLPYRFLCSPAVLCCFLFHPFPPFRFVPAASLNYAYTEYDHSERKKHHGPSLHPVCSSFFHPPFDNRKKATSFAPTKIRYVASLITFTEEKKKKKGHTQPSLLSPRFEPPDTDLSECNKAKHAWFHRPDP